MREPSQVALEDCGVKVSHLQEIAKIYLMVTGGSVERLGGIACALIGVLEEICHDRGRASEQIDKISVVLTKSIYASAIERLEELGAPCAAAHRDSQAKLGPELLSHLLFLKSNIVDLSIVTKTDHTPVLQKLQGVIDAIGT